jgi:hypothetical protein
MADISHPPVLTGKFLYGIRPPDQSFSGKLNLRALAR